MFRNGNWRAGAWSGAGASGTTGSPTIDSPFLDDELLLVAPTKTEETQDKSAALRYEIESPFLSALAPAAEMPLDDLSEGEIVRAATAAVLRGRVDRAVRTRFRLSGDDLRGRVAVVNSDQFANRLPGGAVAELLLNLFLTQANTLVTEIMRQASLIRVVEPSTEAGMRSEVARLRAFIQERMTAGNFELRSLPQLYVKAPITPNALIAASIPGYTTVRRQRADRRVIVQDGSACEVLVHEACHFYMHNNFRQFAVGMGDRFMRGMRLSDVLIEGYAESFAREVMEAQAAVLGPLTDRVYQSYVDTVGLFTTTIGAADARAAFFFGRSGALDLLRRAVEAYAASPWHVPVLLIPRFALEREAASDLDTPDETVDEAFDDSLDEPEMLVEDESAEADEDVEELELVDEPEAEYEDADYVAATDEEAVDDDASLSERLESPQEEYDLPPVSQGVADALGKKEWSRALALALHEGVRDENQLTSLVFHHRHQELGGRALDPKKNKKDKPLSAEWLQILKKEVKPAILKASENVDLKVSGKYVTERDALFSGKTGKQFRDLVEWAAKEAEINPGLLAAVLLAEWDRRSTYLGSGKVSSFDTGTDDFFIQRAQLRANVPAFAQVRFDAKQNTTNTNETGRQVTTVHFKSGKDATLATAVYLKNGEIKLRKAAQQNGGDFDKLSVETCFALVRIAMAAGHGGIAPDGEFRWFKLKNGKRVEVKKGEKGAVLIGVAERLGRVLKGEEILVRKSEPRKHPTGSSHITDRNATILTAQALHLSDWIFGIPLTTAVQPEPEAFEDTDAGYDLEATIDDEYLADELIVETANGVDVADDEATDVIEDRELDPVLLDIAEKVISREAPYAEQEAPARWTRCFSAADVAKVQKAYEENAAAADSNSVDRCSCIVMLNVALGQLLPLRLKENLARGKKSNRRVQMGELTTETIELAMGQLQRKGFAGVRTVIDFFDRRNRTAGTLKPERLEASVRDKVLAKSKTEGCWFAFGMSIMSGYHSVLLLVDHTTSAAKIYWLDQYSRGVNDDVTNSLDQLLTERTQTYWDIARGEKGKGYDTPIRLWPLRKPRKTK